MGRRSACVLRALNNQNPSTIATRIAPAPNSHRSDRRDVCFRVELTAARQAPARSCVGTSGSYRGSYGVMFMNCVNSVSPLGASKIWIVRFVVIDTVTVVTVN